MGYLFSPSNKGEGYIIAYATTRVRDWTTWSGNSFFPLPDTVLQRRLIRGRVRFCEVRPVFLLASFLRHPSKSNCDAPLPSSCPTWLHHPRRQSTIDPLLTVWRACSLGKRGIFGEGKWEATAPRREGKYSSSMSFPLTLHAGMHTSRKSNLQTSLRPRGKKKIERGGRKKEKLRRKIEFFLF